MKVYHGIEEFSKPVHAVVTIGTFDGVHLGHQQIIKNVTEAAEREKGESVVLTFFPHPRMVLHQNDNHLKLITTMSERIELLRKYGIQHLIIQPFTQEFSQLSPTEFVRDILVNKIGTRTLIIGYDHHFGHKREGTYKDLERLSAVFNYRLEEIPVQLINESAISSTKIRIALLFGDIETAKRLLGYDFTLSGKVIDGDKTGRTLGFPTANIGIAENYKLIPAHGIYAATATVEGVVYKGMLYIGNRPALNGKAVSIEINIFDFDRSIYDRDITVHVKDRIRDDMHFSNLDALKEKMREDKMEVLKILI